MSKKRKTTKLGCKMCSMTCCSKSGGQTVDDVLDDILDSEEKDRLKREKKARSKLTAIKLKQWRKFLKEI